MKKKILIVDDEPSIVRLLSRRFETKGYEVFVAHDGMECIQIAQIEVPDLILLDVSIPYLDGISTFDQLIQLDVTKSIPVIFFTALATEEIRTQVRKMGANYLISKPFNSADIEQAAAEYLE